MTDRMLLPSQLSSQSPGTFADPPQGRFRIAARLRFNQTVQRDEQLWIALHDVFPARARPANTSRHSVSVSDLAYPLGNGFSGKATGSSNPRDTSVSQGESFAGSHKSPTPFAKEWPHVRELSPQRPLVLLHPDTSISLFPSSCYRYLLTLPYRRDRISRGTRRSWRMPCRWRNVGSWRHYGSASSSRWPKPTRRSSNSFSGSTTGLSAGGTGAAPASSKPSTNRHCNRYPRIDSRSANGRGRA